jgi:GT2 family glycosyltransferase
MLNQKLKILVSIVTFKTSAELLKKCLKDILKLNDIHISIWDNSSSTNIKKFCNDYEIDYFQSKNIGFGAGHNNNIISQSQKNNFKDIVILNPDVIVRYKNIRSLVSKLKINNIILTPVLLNSDNSIQDFIRRFPTLTNFILRFFKISKIYSISYSDNRLQKVPFAHGAFFVLKLSTFIKFGMFDTRYFLYCEDLDFCRSAHNLGGGVYVDPSVKVIHYFNRASKRSPKLFFIHLHSILRYFVKWGFLPDSKIKEINRLI